MAPGEEKAKPGVSDPRQVLFIVNERFHGPQRLMERSGSRTKIAQRSRNITNLINNIECLLHELSTSKPTRGFRAPYEIGDGFHGARHHHGRSPAHLQVLGRAGQGVLPSTIQGTSDQLVKGPQAANSTISVMKLPTEIRLMIYEFALIIDDSIELWPDTTGFCWSKYTLFGDIKHFKRQQVYRKNRATLAVALLRASKLVSSEAAPIFYRMNSFHFSGQYGWVILEAFLFTIGSTNQKYLADLRFCGPRNVPLYPYFSKAIRILLRNMHLHSPSYDSQDHRPRRNYFAREDVIDTTNWESLAIQDIRRVIEKNGTLRKLSIISPVDWFYRAPDYQDILKACEAKVPGLQLSMVFQIGRDSLWMDVYRGNFVSSLRSNSILSQALRDGWKFWVESYNDKKDRDGNRDLLKRAEITEEEPLYNPNSESLSERELLR